MPHLKSAKKRMRQNLKRREHNRAVMKALKKHLKVLNEISKDKDAAAEALKQQAKATVKKLDKAAARRVIHPNLAARKKSQIARMLTAKSKPAPAAAPAN
ncbi:MAG TPA: 30S ribosomal protein S20 [Gemmataceae bacterium]|nr:30S ribosomal protein S20 [Gemmataceae bacterium]